MTPKIEVFDFQDQDLALSTDLKAALFQGATGSSRVLHQDVAHPLACAGEATPPVDVDASLP